MHHFYDELAPFWPLLSPVDDYREEAAEVRRLLEAAHPGAQTLLELGSGGGHNAFHLRERFALTLTDLSPAMLRVSAELNPGCEHVAGDMRTLELGRTFDLVFAHDALDYLTTEADLAATFATAHRHLAPGGVALFAPDAVAERFTAGTDCGGSDAPDGRGIRYLEWTFERDPADHVATTQYTFVVREADGAIRTLTEAHVVGVFPQATWTRLLEAAGFAVEAVEEQTDDDRTPRVFFLARRGV